MNPHLDPPTSPQSLLRSIWTNRKLIRRMVRRDIVGRYRGSMLGLGWSFLNPLFMLALYTFVFSVVFNARWGVDGDEGKLVFAIVLYVGLICHGLLSEAMLRAPNLIQANTNYVKKVVFPLEVLPIVATASALFHSLVSLLVWMVMFFAVYGFLHWTVLLIPLVLFPLVLITLGVCWALSSAGVYLRDIGQTVGILSTMLLFFAPIFFPLGMLPERFHLALMANPLTFAVEQARNVLIFGQLPDWSGLAIYTVIACCVAWVGYWWFQKTRKGFADVL